MQAATELVLPAEQRPTDDGEVAMTDNVDTDSAPPPAKCARLELSARSSKNLVRSQPPRVSVSDVTPFNTFVTATVAETGCLRWRIHTPQLNIIAMHDINLKDMSVHNNNYVHLEIRVQNGMRTIHCPCDVFRNANNDALEGVRCLHARFYSDHIAQLQEAVFAGHNVEVTPLVAKLRQSITYVNIPVVRLDESHKYHRYSVIADDVQSCALVNLQGDRLSCAAGRCRAGKGHKRKVVRLGDAENCPHLSVMAQHREVWSPYQEEAPTDNTAPEETPEEVRSSVSIA